jgi:hypothetical protein
LGVERRLVWFQVERALEHHFHIGSTGQADFVTAV